MSKILKYLIEIVAAIIIMFFVVFNYYSLKITEIERTNVKFISSNFLEKIEKTGLIELNDLDTFYNSLDDTNNNYNLVFEHTYTMYEPEYRLRTIDEVLEEQNKNYTGDNFYTFKEIISELPYIEDPIDNSGLIMNTESNASVLANSIPSGPSGSHVHNSSCFTEINVKKHTHSGNVTTGGGCYTQYIAGSSSPCLSNVYEDGYWFSDGYEGTCPKCNGVAHVNTIYQPCRCSSGHTWSELIVWNLSCNECDYHAQSDNSLPGSCPHIEYSPGHYILTCDKNIEKWYTNHGNGTEVFPVCDKKIISLEPTHTIQTLYLNESLITTAKVTFLDGSTKYVVCICNESTNIVSTNKTVPLTYTYILNGTTYTLSENIIITVIPKSKTCKHGHIYNLNPNGSDPGCIYCKNYVSFIRIIHPSTNQIEILVGSSLSENGITLEAVYMDGHSELITSGYLDNLDNKYVGDYKTVTIGYKGAYTTLQVKCTKRKMQCDICHNYYELYPDGTNPGCPYCLLKTPIFTGNILTYSCKKYSDDIIDMITANGCYSLKKNDLLKLSLIQKNENVGGVLLGKLFRFSNINRIYVSKIITIKDEKRE